MWLPLEHPPLCALTDDWMLFIFQIFDNLIGGNQYLMFGSVSLIASNIEHFHMLISSAYSLFCGLSIHVIYLFSMMRILTCFYFYHNYYSQCAVFLLFYDDFLICKVLSFHIFKPVIFSFAIFSHCFYTEKVFLI